MTDQFPTLLSPGEISRRQFIRTGLGGLAATSMGGLLTACGSSSDPATDSKLTPRRGGTLRVGLSGGSSTDSLDAHNPVSSPDIARVFNLYDPIAGIDARGQSVLVLAEEIESNSAADVWTIRLKPDLEFHNGKAITADDLIFTMRRIADPKAPTAAAPNFRRVRLDELRKLDARTVRVPMRAADAVFGSGRQLWWAGVVPEGYDPRKPVGSGPFKLDSFNPGERSVFSRFDNYHGRPTWVDRLELVNINDDNARVNALQGGQVDAIENVPYPQVKVLESNPKTRLLRSETGAFRPFVMRCDAAPFDDVRVRQAMRLVIDRQQMVDQALAGEGRVAHDLYSPFDPCYAKELKRERDVEQARALLRQAGQQDLRVELAVTPAAAGLVEAGQVLAEQAKAAGITVRVRNVDPGTYFADYGKWRFGVDFWPNNAYFLQVRYGDLPESGLNPAHFNDPEFTRLYAQAIAETDENRRCAIARDMQQIQFERGGHIIWGFANVLDATSSRVGGLRSDQSGWGLSKYGFANAFLADPSQAA